MDLNTIAVSAVAAACVSAATAYVTARLQNASERSKWQRELAQGFAQAATVGQEEAQRLAVQFASGFVKVLAADDGENQRYFIPANCRVTIGRGPTCDIRLSDAAVSTTHAALVSRGRQVRIEDFGSTQGVSVNAQSICGHQVLRSGDIIQLGRTHLQFFALRDPRDLAR